METKTARKTGLPIVIGLLLASGPALAEETCVEIEIGGEKTPTLSCINQRLKRQAEQAHPVDVAPPLDAASPPVKTGGFNQPALKQQYGPNFGKSAQPYRPPQTYPSPTGNGK